MIEEVRNGSFRGINFAINFVDFYLLHVVVTNNESLEIVHFCVKTIYYLNLPIIIVSRMMVKVMKIILPGKFRTMQINICLMQGLTILIPMLIPTLPLFNWIIQE